MMSIKIKVTIMIMMIPGNSLPKLCLQGYVRGKYRGILESNKVSWCLFTGK